MADTLMRELWEKSVVDRILECLESNPEYNIPKVVGLIDNVLPKDCFQERRAALRRSIETRDNYYRLMRRSYDLNLNSRKHSF